MHTAGATKFSEGIIRIVVGALLMLTLLPISLTGQDSVSVEAWDQSRIEFRHPQADTIRYYQSLSEYQYEQAKNPVSLWDKFWRWVNELLSGKGIDGGTLRLFFIVLVIVIFAIIIFFLLGIRLKGLFFFSRKVTGADIAFNAHSDDIHDTRLDDLLKMLIHHGAWREATRILYLISLRELNKHQLIAWSNSKTNKDYYYELKDPSLKRIFRQAALNYEYAWYGQFQVEDHHFETIRMVFEDMKQQIQKQPV